jgi:hypothetical protein
MGKRFSHGGNNGSNPLGDANLLKGRGAIPTHRPRFPSLPASRHRPAPAKREPIRVFPQSFIAWAIDSCRERETLRLH